LKLPIPKEACQKIDAHERQAVNSLTAMKWTLMNELLFGD
jgi:hypothetical protein